MVFVFFCNIALSSIIAGHCVVMFDAKILNNIIMQIADGKISAGSKHRVF